MDMLDDENLILRLREYDRMHFSLLIVLYYHKNINKVMDLTQINSKNLFVNIPSGIRKVIDFYQMEDKIKIMREEALEDFLRKECDYLNKNIKSVFSLWNILFSQFAYLYAISQELTMEIFSELNVYSMEHLRKLLYVGENFNEDSLSELLCILARIENYQEIHIINYDTGSIDTAVCLEKVKGELYHVEPDSPEAMIKRIVIVEAPQLSFAYLNHYIEQYADEKFIIVIGMERLVEFIGEGEINIKLMNTNFNLGTSETINWKLFVKRINEMYARIADHSAFLLTVYIVNNVMDDAKQKIQLHYRDELVFDILFDQTRAVSDNSVQERELFGELLDLIFYDKNAYEKLLGHKDELSQDNFTMLKAYFYLSRKDYFQAVSELEQLSDDTDIYSQFLRAELYNMIGETEAAYRTFKEIYAKDKYYPNLVNSILYSLRDSEDQGEQLFWIKKGLEINPHDPVMVHHLAHYYTQTGDYMASAKQWKNLYGLTEDPFYAVLCEINYILFSAGKSQMDHIGAWVVEKETMYPQYANEINSRIGVVIFDKIGADKALPYFGKVAESYDESYCIAAEKMMEIYYKKCSRIIDKRVEQEEVKSFAQKLLKYVVILTYGTRSIYSWSDYIHKLFSYDEWAEVSHQLLIACLSELAKGCLRGEAETTKLVVNKENADIGNRYFEDYEGTKTLNQEKMNTGEHLLILLAMGKTKIAQGENQMANDIAYTLFRQAGMYEDDFYKDISMSFGLLIWSGTSMAIGAYAEGSLAFIAAADRLMKIHETAVLHEAGFVFDQFLYLYGSQLQIKPESADQILFEKYFNRMGYQKAMLYHMFGMNEKIIGMEGPEFKTLIRQTEEANIVLLAKNESLENILFFDALILAYYKTGELNKADIYLRRLFPSIAMTLTERIDIAYHLLMRYTDILTELKNFNFTIEILHSLLQVIEKLRGLSFDSERSYLGNPADIIIRRFLYIYCKNGGFAGTQMEANELLHSLLINMVPKSMIEQKNGNAASVVDETLLKKEREYYMLFEELNHTRRKTVSDLVYKNIVDRFLETKKYLEENHPAFKPLKKYSLIGWNAGNPFEFLESKLKEGEVFYRNILTEDYLIHIVVTEKAYHLCSEKINVKELEGLLASLEKMINREVVDLEKMESDFYIHLFEDLTKILFQPLVERIDLIDSLYYMPDHKLLHITPNFIRADDKWGVACFNKMELIIDYNNIGSSNRTSNHGKNLCYVSDSQKGGLQEIRRTMDQFQDFTKAEINQFGYIEITEPVNILVIAAHGVSEEFGRSYSGAKKLSLSRKKQIDLKEFIVIHSATVENAIIIACSGGTPTNEKIERNNGVWDSMLRKNVKYILYCKWDVSTIHTNKMLNAILEEMRSEDMLLSEALNMAQRKMTGLNPILWAGLEVWKN